MALISSMIQCSFNVLKKNYRPSALRELAIVATLSSCLLACYFALPHFGYAWTWSGSLPIGLWKKNTLNNHTQYVEFCLRQNTYAHFFRTSMMMEDDNGPYPCPHNIPRFIKPVLARPGDIIELTNASVLVNNVPLPNSATLFKSPSMGISVPHIARGRYKVEPGTVWVFSTYNNASFDSRYYGSIPMEWIVGGIEPAFVYANPPDYLISSPSDHPPHCFWRFCWITTPLANR